MAEDDELEKRAVEELLRETNRARVRAETMGPTGWLKCPLRGTNKRFLLNTLRSTGLQRRIGDPRDRPSAARGRPRNDSPDRSRNRSRTPPRDRRRRGDHTDHKQHHRDSCNNKDREDRDRERTYRHKDNRDQRHDRDLQNKDRDRLHE